MALSRDWLWEALLEKFPGNSLEEQHNRLLRCSEFYRHGSDDFVWLPKIAPDAFNETRLQVIRSFLMQLQPYRGASISEMIALVIQTTGKAFPEHLNLVFDYSFRLFRRACLDELYRCNCADVGSLVTQLEERINSVRAVSQRSTV